MTLSWEQIAIILGVAAFVLFIIVAVADSLAESWWRDGDPL